MSLTLVDASVPPPVLEIVDSGARTVELSWPTNAAGYRLESAMSRLRQVWTPVTNAIESVGDSYSVQLGANGSQSFFRLGNEPVRTNTRAGPALLEP